MLSTGSSISIFHLIIVLARVHIRLLNIHPDITPANYGLLEIPLRVGNPLLIALAEYSASSDIIELDRFK